MRTFALLVFLSACCLASVRNFDVDVDMDESVGTGNYQIGKILITPRELVSDYKVRTNYSGFNAQVGDTFVWSGSETVLLKLNSVLVSLVEPSSDYIFGTAGTYTFTSSLNASQIGQIVVTESVNPQLSLLLESDDLNFTLSNCLFQLNATDKMVYVNADIDKSIVADNYDWKLTVKSPNKTITKTGNIEVSQSKIWAITSNNLSNVTIRSGVSEALGVVEIENQGNVNFDISLTKTGNGSDFIYSQSSATLYKRNRAIFSFIVQVPVKTKFGQYETDLLFTGGSNHTNIHLNVTVTDTSPPEIKNISIKDNYVFNDNLLTAQITDNLDVAYVTVNYANQTFNMTRDVYVFSHKFMATSLSPYVMRMCAYDTSSNKYCIDINKTFGRLSIIEFEPSVKLPTQKVNTFANATLFKLLQDSKHAIQVKLVDFSTNANSTGADLKVRVLDGDGTIYVLEDIGNVVSVTRKGYISIQVLSNMILRYDGIIRIIVPEYMENVTMDIHFFGEFKEYAVVDNFEQIWYNDKVIRCTPRDTGVVETSEYICNINFPITTDLKEMLVPTTLAEKQMQEQKSADLLSGKEREMQMRNYIISALVGLFVISALLLVYVIRIHPILRMRFGGD